MLKRILIAGILALGTGFCLAQQGEQTTREEISKEVAQALIAGDFRRLDAWAKTYREEQAKTPSGVWKLALFYVGIKNAVEKQSETGGKAAVNALLTTTDADRKST